MITSFLQRLKILDTDGTLCLSHITMAASLILLLANPIPETIGAFTLSLLNFNAKKFFALMKARKEKGDQETLDRIQLEIERLGREHDKLNAAMTFTKMRQ